MLIAHCCDVVTIMGQYSGLDLGTDQISFIECVRLMTCDSYITVLSKSFLSCYSCSSLYVNA